MDNKRINELYNQLPSSWSELKYKDFVRITALLIAEEAIDGEEEDMFKAVDANFNIVAALIDITVAELEELPYSTSAAFINKIAFLSTPPQPLKVSQLSWKKFDELTYDNYVTLETFASKPMENMFLLIKAVCKDKELTQEQFDELAMDEIYTGFFFSNQVLKEIRKQFESVFNQKASEADKQSDFQENTLQAELAKQKQTIQKSYGWHFLAKDVADYNNCRINPDVYEMAAIEVLSLVMVMQAKIQLNQTTNG